MSNRSFASQILWMMAASIGLTVVMVVGTLLWTSAEHDRQAADRLVMMIKGGLDAAFRRYETLVLDAAHWDNAYDAITVQDYGWLWENYGMQVGGDSFDLVAVAWPEPGATIGWERSTEADLRSDLIPADVVAHVRATLVAMPRSSWEVVSFALRRPEGNYIVAASLVEPLTEDRVAALDRSSLAIAFIGRRIDDRLAQKFMAAYDVSALRIVDRPGAKGASLPILDHLGAPVAHMVWVPPRPGRAMIETAAKPLSIALSLFLLVSGTVTIIARRNARALMDSEAHSAKIARTDSLTGLPNRMAFGEHLARIVESDAPSAILFMDVNGFKLVNDTVGHHAGDELVRLLSMRCRYFLPPGAFLARVGGDEFNVIFHGADPDGQVEVFAHRLHASLQAPFLLEGRSFTITIAMGYTVGAHSEVSSSELVRRADLAMYEAKNLRTKHPLRYHPGMETDSVRAKQIEEGLRKALLGDTELELHYQPVIEAATGRMRLAEGLLRWTCPEMGRVSPGLFIPIAERSGLMIDLGLWVIERACRDMASLPGLRVAVNLSPAQLLDPDLAASVARAMLRHGIGPDRLEFELTEGLIVESPELAAFKLDQLREAGHSIALDDFGTGFSSIGYLRKMNFNKLKVDKSFVDDIGRTGQSTDLLQSLVLLARSLDLEIVAEGVERSDQVEILTAMGFPLLQGFIFSRPMAFPELCDHVRAGASEGPLRSAAHGARG